MREKVIALLSEHKIPRLCRILKQMSPQDIAALAAEIPEEYLPLLFRILTKDTAAEVFVEMDSDLQETLITAFSDRELQEVLTKLFADDTVDIIEEMPANVVTKILRNSSPLRRAQINELLKYPADSAGSIMTLEYVDLKKDMTVEEAFAKIRRTGPDRETIYTCYVTDESRRLIGTVSAKDLMLAQSENVINDIMTTNFISVLTTEDRESAAMLFDKYDLLAIPVVDTENRMVGIITFDDAIDVLREESTEDIEKMAAMSPSEDTYFKTSVFTHAKKRIVWLLVLMLSATITGGIITRYESAIAAVPLLVAFLPMLMDTGGNCGSQSSTMMVRGLALGEIKTGDFWRAIFKEFLIALTVGVALAAVNTVRVLIMNRSDPLKFKLALVTGLALMCAVVIAKLLGCALPMLAKKIKIDPALMSAPIITTMLDACSVLIYFVIASAVLHIPS